MEVILEYFGAVYSNCLTMFNSFEDLNCFRPGTNILQPHELSLSTCPTRWARDCPSLLPQQLVEVAELDKMSHVEPAALENRTAKMQAS